MAWEIRQGDWVERLREMPDESVHCVVTSPPYWGLRDYGVAGQLGLERTPEEYIAKMVEGFREVRRVLRSDGTLWLNMGDCYFTAPPGRPGKCEGISSHASETGRADNRPALRRAGLKCKDLIGIPWMLSLALRADGWYLRSDIIWAKPNPMPESVTDRPTKAHEYIFLLAKSERYYFDAEAIKEPLKDCSIDRLKQPTFDQQNGGPKDYGHRTNTNRSARKALCNLKEKLVRAEKWGDRYEGWAERDPEIGRNKRSVWEIATSPFPEAHFATFPPKLVEPCILAGTSERGCCAKCGAPRKRILSESPGLPRERDESRNCPPGSISDGRNNISGKMLADWREQHPVHTVGWEQSCGCDAGEAGDNKPCTVLDPFAGAGTTGLVALRYGRSFIGIDLKADYVAMARERIKQDSPLFNVTSELCDCCKKPLSKNHIAILEQFAHRCDRCVYEAT